MKDLSIQDVIPFLESTLQSARDCIARRNDKDYDKYFDDTRNLVIILIREGKDRQDLISHALDEIAIAVRELH